MEYDVYNPLRGLNIPCQGYKVIAGVITKSIPNLGGQNNL